MGCCLPRRLAPVLSIGLVERMFSATIRGVTFMVPTLMGWLNNLVRMICAMLLAGMLALVIGQVSVRFLFGMSWVWVEEVIRYSLTWLGFLGIALAVMSHTHAEVDYFVNKMPVTARKVVTLLVLLICLAFFVFLMVYGYRVAITQTRFRSPILRISAFYRMIVIPISASIIVVDLSVKTVAKVRADWIPGFQKGND